MDRGKSSRSQRQRVSVVLLAAAIGFGGATLAPAQPQIAPATAQTVAVPPAPGPAGRWETENGRSHIEIGPCGPKFCGKIVWLKQPLDDAGNPKLDGNNPDESLRTRPMLGLPLMTDFSPADESNVWEGGQIYNPNNGKFYSAKLTLVDDRTLELRGYVLLPLFGGSQTWKRVDPVPETAGGKSGGE